MSSIPMQNRKKKDQEKHNKITIHDFAVKNAKKLGLSTFSGLKIWVSSFQEMHHVSDSGKLIVDFVAQITQRKEVPLDQDDPNSPLFTFRGGITLILGQDGQVHYIIHKKLGEKMDDRENKRLKRQRDYLRMRQSSLAAAPYIDVNVVHLRAWKADFSIIHRGY